MPDAPARDPADRAPLLAVENLVKHFPVRGGIFGRAIAQVHAVDGVSFTLRERETLGIVGESGCGKSTLARMIVRLTDPTGGTIRLRGTDISTLSAGAMRRYRRDIQFVFQDPYASLNPRLRAGAIVGEAIENFETATDARSAGAWRRCSPASACGRRRCTTIRTNSPAASASGSASRGRLPSTRTSSWRTSRSRRSMCRCRRR